MGFKINQLGVTNAIGEPQRRSFMIVAANLGPTIRCSNGLYG